MKKKQQQSNYFEQAAKQCQYPVDLKERLIIVPEGELQAACNELIVQHLQKHGFSIQLTIPEAVVKTAVFDPEIKMTHRPHAEVSVRTVRGFTRGDKFIDKYRRAFKITELYSQHAEFIDDKGKKFSQSYESINRNLGFKNWEKL